MLFVLNKGSKPDIVFYDLKGLFGTKALFQYRFNREDSRKIESEKISYFSDTIILHEAVLLLVTGGPLNEKPSNLSSRKNNLLSKRMKMKESEK